MIVLASEDTVAKRSILPVAWVGAVLMAAAVVLSMPDKAQADTCWGAWGCANQHPYFCQSDCQNSWCGDGWACVQIGSSGYSRCKCF